jgi:hypothetical protein
VEDNNILVDEQAGFRKGRSVIDQLFILTDVIRNRRPKKTFCAFIDIQKAYDRVWRQGLWYKLHKHGIRGKLWRSLKNIYSKVESCVVLDDICTDFFEILVGLRQGCLLSPILFDIFINDLAEEIKKLNLGVYCGKQKIAILMFADDIVLLAENRKDLETMLCFTYDFSLKWRYKFNFDKCGVVVFDNQEAPDFTYGKCDQNCTCGSHYAFGPHLIKELGVYKYLGVELDKQLSFNEFKNRILDRAKRNLSKIWFMGIRTGFLSIKASINLWETLVRSQLEYAAEIIPTKLWKEPEALQMDFCRRVLRCSSMTAKLAMQGELGLWTLQSRRDLKMLIWWFNVITTDDSRLIKHIYVTGKQIHLSKKKGNWTSMVKKVLIKYNLKPLWDDEKFSFSLKDLYTATIRFFLYF